MKKYFKQYGVALCYFSVIVLILICSPFLVSHSYSDGNYSEIKVSIIVPVYNTEKYLDECLESLENQTLKEIEIICVNDGSKDNSLEILEQHKQKDSRVKIINQQNAGVCVARNNGIEAAKGDYIIFCDSDDLIPPYAYEKAYENAVKYNVNVVGLKLMTFEEGKETINLSDFQYDSSKVRRCGRKKYQNPFYYMLENSAYVVTKLFKRSFILENNLRFKEGVTNYEDGLFNFMAFPLITEMVQDDNIFYCYRVNRPNSAVTAFNARKVLNSAMIVAEELVSNRERFNFRKADEWILDKIMDVSYNHIVKDTKEDELKQHYANHLLGIIEKYLSDYKVTPSNENKEKIDVLKSIANQ